jgi:hypothetical protein
MVTNSSLLSISVVVRRGDLVEFRCNARGVDDEGGLKCGQDDVHIMHPKTASVKIEETTM